MMRSTLLTFTKHAMGRVRRPTSTKTTLDDVGGAQLFASRQDHAVLDTGHAVEELNDFLGAENNREFLRLLRSWNDRCERPVPFEGDFVQETKCRNSGENRTGSQLLFGRQIDLVGTNLFRSQQFRGLAEMAREHGDLDHIHIL